MEVMRYTPKKTNKGASAGKYGLICCSIFVCLPEGTKIHISGKRQNISEDSLLQNRAG